ncbi:MAG: hypothetical protein JSV33_08135 [bacterium]|nr:MAG: hypothetical protein JSV33_08135 [bacterium]
MNRALFTFISLLMIASITSAQLPPVGYIGLTLDDFQFQNGCSSGVGFYPLEIWIYCLPSDEGMICAKFMIDYPPNVIQSTVTTNPAVSVTLGTLDTGMSVCFADCHWNWIWPFHQALYVTDSTPTEVLIVKHPDPNILCVQFANCNPGYPTECVR